MPKEAPELKAMIHKLVELAIWEGKKFPDDDGLTDNYTNLIYDVVAKWHDNRLDVLLKRLNEAIK